MIIFDLDGTLADCEHRRHFVTPTENCKYIYTDSIPHENGCILTGHWENKEKVKWKPDWKAFYEACGKDKPIKNVINIFQACYEMCEFRENIQIWSGRCESVRAKTNTWLLMNVTTNLEILKSLKMRPIGDHTPDDILKERWLDETISQGNKVDFVFDDRPKVVRMWRRRGIFVFDVNQTGKEF